MWAIAQVSLGFSNRNLHMAHTWQDTIKEISVPASIKSVDRDQMQPYQDSP